MDRFKHLKDSSFPDVSSVDVFKYKNEFDYSRYNYNQMHLQICNVPWDVGEAHVGQRTLSGIGNVVYFGSADERDAWFDSIPDSKCYRFDTKYKELHRDQYIDVPMPFDVCARFNYLRVQYVPFANDDSYIEYETDDSKRDWFWFVREVEFVAPNTTRLHLLDDAWQTWIYDVTISSMILERGHAPMFAVSAQDYLSNPLENNEYLLTDDVDYGRGDIVRSVDSLVLNDDDMWAVIATTGNITGNWGSKDDDTWQAVASATYTMEGSPSVGVFAIEAANLNDLLRAIQNNMPQFKQTIQAVWFASEKIITLGNTVEFLGYTCRRIVGSRKTHNLKAQLTTDDFGYDDKYKDIAKLYTWPYAHIEVSDENGDIDVIRIEDTTGKLDVSVAMSNSYPFITIESHLLDAGGSAGASITFKNINSHTFSFSGKWYETLRTWNVPTFAVVLDAGVEYDYSTHYDRAQRVVDYTTAYNNVSASATANKENVATIAAANKANADASADMVVDNATLTTTANTAITSASNGSADDTLDNVRDYNFGVMDADNAIISSTATATIEAQEQQAAISAASGAVSGVTGAISSAVSGNVAGAVASAVNGIVGAASTLASTNISVHLASAEAAISQDSNEAHAELSTEKTQNDTATQKATANTIRNIQNTLTSGQAANSAATTKANATRSQTAENTAATNTYNTDIANAGRSRSQSQSAIANNIAQANMRAPFVFGSFADGKGNTTKPMALFAHVVTQTDSAISSAGDEFLRYGYRFGKQWSFDGNWNCGKYFSYWKLNDFWVSDLNVPDLYMDKLRFFLFGGVTVWRSPEYIGKVNVYDNYE